MILCSVRQHKARCVIRYDQVTAQATTYDELMTGFLASLGDTMHEEAHLHHLWYDIRAQTVFEAALRADVVEIDKSLENMIWRIVSRFAELTGEPQTMPPSVIYAMLDGLFQFSAMRKPSPRCRPTFGWWSRLLALCDELDDWANQTNTNLLLGYHVEC